VDNSPQMVPQPEGVSLSMPAGFKAEVFAEGFNNSGG